MGRDGMRLHEWVFALATFKRMTGQEGGLETIDDEILAETQARPRAVVMGRGMFGGGPRAWRSAEWGDGVWEGWWGPEPPYGKPVFVLTHHEREPLVLAPRRSRSSPTAWSPRSRRRRRRVGDGRRCSSPAAPTPHRRRPRPRLLDEIQVHVVPLLLCRGKRLFAGQAHKNARGARGRPETRGAPLSAPRPARAASPS